MPCPFLREGRGLYCHKAPIRKLLLDGPGVTGGGRCTSPDYTSCDLLGKDDLGHERCPHLEEVQLQYCAASPITKLVPLSETQRSPCTSTGYRYCDSYLLLARPHQQSAQPADLLFAPNHMWLEVEDAGRCHIGIDAFLAKTAGKVEKVTFVSTQGTHRPAVALTVNSVEWPLIFPNPLLIERVNTHLRADPARVTTDPYGTGWLFEGWELPGRTRAGLMGGEQAKAWLTEENQRLAYMIQEVLGIAGDGGLAEPGVAQMLPRENVVALFQRFFSKRDWTLEE